MAKMDFTAKCDTRRGDEIGDLARDLNTLSSELDSKIRELEGMSQYKAYWHPERFGLLLRAFVPSGGACRERLC